MRHDVDVGELDFLIHMPLKQQKTFAFRQVRMDYGINPARAYACGDEKKDFVATLSSGMHPLMVSYGFEDFERLALKIGVPAEVISKTPAEFRSRACHALDADPAGPIPFGDCEPPPGAQQGRCKNSLCSAYTSDS